MSNIVAFSRSDLYSPNLGSSGLNVLQQNKAQLLGRKPITGGGLKQDKFSVLFRYSSLVKLICVCGLGFQKWILISALLQGTGYTVLVSMPYRNVF